MGMDTAPNAERARRGSPKSAARALEALIRQQLLTMASDCDFPTTSDENIEGDKASLP